MNVKRHLLTTRRPMLVAEAVYVFPIVLGFEAVVAGGDGAFMGCVAARRILNLQETLGGQQIIYIRKQRADRLDCAKS